MELSRHRKGPRQFRTLKTLLHIHKPGLIFPLETKCDRSQQLTTIGDLHGIFQVDSINQEGGLTLLWNEELKGAGKIRRSSRHPSGCSLGTRQSYFSRSDFCKWPAATNTGIRDVILIPPCKLRPHYSLGIYPCSLYEELDFCFVPIWLCRAHLVC